MNGLDLTGGAFVAMSIVRLIGMYLLGDKDARGWFLAMASGVLSIAWATYTQAYGLIPIATATILLSWRGYRRWGRIADARRVEAHRLRNRIQVLELRLQEALADDAR